MKAVNLLHLEIWHVQGEGMGEPGSEPGQDSVWQHTPKVCQLHGCLWVGGGSIAHICQPTIWNPNIITTLGCTIRLQSNLRRLRWCSERPFRLMTQLLDWRVSRWFSNTKCTHFLLSQFSRWGLWGNGGVQQGRADLHQDSGGQDWNSNGPPWWYYRTS